MRWASRWYRLAVRQLPPIRHRKACKSRLHIEALEAREVPHIHGAVFIDLNMDGNFDPEDIGVENVTVTSTDSTGATASATTDAAGSYELEVDADVRIEFSGLPEGTLPGRVAGTSGAMVRFVGAERDNVDLALAQPMLVTSQFYYDDALEGTNLGQSAVLAVPYGDPNNPSPVTLAMVSEVGSVWGLTNQPSSNSVYASSFVKRHAGLGPNAAGTGTTTGGIYRINRAVDPIEVSLLIDLNTVSGFGAGADPHPTTPEFDGGDWFHDASTLPFVGKRGLGGLQISPDGRTLYVMNLSTRQLIEIGLNADGTRDTSRPLRGTPIPLVNPAGSGITSFNTNDLRPFAVAVKGNAVFVGVTYTAETSQFAQAMRAFVYAFDPSTGTFRKFDQTTGAFVTGAVTPVLMANLNYTRGVADDPDFDPGTGDEISANWRPWTAAFDTATGQEFVPVHPEPWLTDIVFDGEAIVLGLRDRSGDQGGFQTGNATASDEEPTYTPIAVGDILRAAPNGAGGWALESNGASGTRATVGASNGQGPGGGEFYFEDNIDPFPQEVVTGGLAQVPGFQTVAVTGNDPISSFAGGIYTFLNSDTDPSAENTTGAATTRMEIYVSDTLDTFGSSNGLGDLEALAVEGTVQVGDRVFVDMNNNGLQDVGEQGISGVVLRLFRAGSQVDSVTTGTGGDFVFNDLLPNTAYEIRIDTAQTTLTGRTLSTANQGSNDELDSDGTQSGTTATIAFTTGAEGTTNTSLDAGFSALAASLTLGNLVFRDVDNNGQFGTGDSGIDGVLVELLDNQGAPMSGKTTTTSGGGLYTFTGLDANTYMVRLAASNFNAGGVLFGFTSSAQSGSVPNDNNNDDDGTVNGQLGNGGVIISGPITLSVNGEPDTDGDSSKDTNLTLDFGVVPPSGLTLGNMVFNDANNSGLLDPGESGIDGVSVQLLNAQGTVIDTKTTANGGLYSFTGLAPGDYRVRLQSTNFVSGGALFNFASTKVTAADPDNDVDGNDDGFSTGVLGNDGFIESGLITLAADSEPTNDGDPNNSNLTVDFGMAAIAANTLSLGNRVFRDVDNSGTLNNAETGIAGVMVQLLNDSDSVLDTAFTDSTGTYTFTNLPSEDYRVRLAASNFNAGGVLVNLTTSANPIADPDNDADNDNNGVLSGTLGSGGFIQSGLITLTAGGEPTADGDGNHSNLTLDFGLAPPTATTLSLGSTVFIDANGNGLLDTGESPMAGVVVQLVNPTGTVLQTHTTDASGLYTFTGVAPGDYRVRLATSNFQTSGVLVGFTSSTGTNGALTGTYEVPPDPDNNIDSDDNGLVVGTLGQANGAIESALISLAFGAEINDGDNDPSANLSLDFGVFRKFSIGNLVFKDTDNDGTQDTAETGIANVSVRLLNAGNGNALVGTATTDSSGNYLFSNLVPGNYIVELAATNFNAGGALFSFKSSFGDGFEPPTNPTDKQDHGRTIGTFGAGGTIQSGTIALGPTANAPTGETPSTDTATPDNQSNQTIDFGVIQVVPLLMTSIAGRVFLDFNNSGTLNGPDTGIQGVTMTLSGGTLGTPLTVQTDASGNFGFNNLPAGTYTLVQTQPTTPSNHNGKITPGNAGGTVTLATNTISNIVLTSARVATGYNFAEVPLLTTGGLVFEDLDGDGVKDTGEPGIPDVTVTLTGTSVVTGAITPRTAVTNASGNYTFTDLTPGTYTLVETQPSTYVDGKEQNGAPAATTVSNDRFAGINLTTTSAASGGFNFGEVKGASIAGVVYDDVDDNGVQAATGEAGIAGVKIRLQGTNDLGRTVNTTVVTGSNGAYAFNGLRPGTYRLTETQPTGYGDGKETAPAPAVTSTNDQISNIVLASSASATGYLFGEHAAPNTADVVISQTPANTSVAPGGNVTITFTVRNNGTGVAAGVSALINYGNLTFVSANSADFNSTNRTWTVGELAAGANETIQITFQAATAGTFHPSSQVSTTSTESSTTNNTSRSTVRAGAAPTPQPPAVVKKWWFLSSSTNAYRRPR